MVSIITDGITKPLQRIAFERFKDLMGLEWNMGAGRED